MNSKTISPVDKDSERKQALAKVYSLLLKLAEQNETASSDDDLKEKESTESEPLKTNIPSSGKV